MSDKIKCVLSDWLELITLLEGMASGLRKGHLALTNGKDRLVLHPRQSMRLGFRVRRKARKEKIEITMKWDHALRIGRIP
jgi:amphi-Trp domain-containing protein